MPSTFGMSEKGSGKKEENTLDRRTKVTLMVAVLGTLVTLILWAATGFYPYTKYEDVRKVEIKIDAEDNPLEAAMALEDEKPQFRTEVVSGFFFGIVPGGMFDKNAISVLSISAPLWGLFALFYILGIIKNIKSKGA